ncbi:MAG: PfkB family carbohydrate kinase [Chloroflexota bacterium]|nr:PfkB family carbohydrate kinase [Chloroflexota bacterium]
MSVLVVGSVGLDDIQTPFGRRTGALGGACTYFATAASLYTSVGVIGVVGDDFPRQHIDFLASRGVDVRGLQIVEGETFSWAGRYGEDLGDAETLDTQLNVFADFHPAIPEDLCGADSVFLANIDPDLQLEVLEQIDAPRLTALDSMNFWISSKKESLTRVLSRVDIALLNESEIRQFAEEPNLFAAAQHILDIGPKALVIKRGCYGAMLIVQSERLEERYFSVPAYPSQHVVDPTGAGDTFAAGFMGYLDRVGVCSLESLRRAVVHGTVVASFTVEDFSIDGLRNRSMKDIQERYESLRSLTYFESMPKAQCEAFQRSFIE